MVYGLVWQNIPNIPCSLQQLEYAFWFKYWVVCVGVLQSTLVYYNIYIGFTRRSLVVVVVVMVRLHLELCVRKYWVSNIWARRIRRLGNFWVNLCSGGSTMFIVASLQPQYVELPRVRWYQWWPGSAQPHRRGAPIWGFWQLPPVQTRRRRLWAERFPGLMEVHNIFKKKRLKI